MPRVWRGGCWGWWAWKPEVTRTQHPLRGILRIAITRILSKVYTTLRVPSENASYLREWYVCPNRVRSGCISCSHKATAYSLF